MKRLHPIRIVIVALFSLATAPAHLRAATITITNTADSGAGTLRAALASANDGDTINFALLTPAKITLTSGELLVAKSVNILGPGATNLAVDGNAAGRVFHVTPSNIVAISGLTITGGFAGPQGGDYPAGNGGGVFNDHSTLTILNCTLVGNQAGGQGAGIENYAGHPSSGGGNATLAMTNCTFQGNRANLGGAIDNNAETGNAILIVVGCLLRTNSAAEGGGIANFAYAGTGDVRIIASTFSYNGAQIGGAIISGSSLEIVNSTMNGNGADGGGAILASGTLKVSGCTLYGNSAGRRDGGGILSYGNGTIVNTTLDGNSATRGGAIANEANGSPVGTLSVRNCTLSGNAAYSGGGILNDVGSSLELGSTILKAGVEGGNIANQPQYGGSVLSLGFNLSSDDGGGFLTNATDQINTDPLLGPLQDNGGPTFTHALLGCSPAIDQGKNFTGLLTDQRDSGTARTFDDPNVPNAVGGDGTDIGAFEAPAPVADITPPVIACPDNIVANATSPAGAAVSFAPTASDNCSVANVSCDPPSGSTFASGTTTVTCLAIDSSGNANTCSFTIHIEGAAEQISDLTAGVQSLAIDSGVKRKLLLKLQAASKVVNSGNEKRACSAMQDFISECNAQVTKGNLDASLATILISEVTRILAVIGCK
jgi:hypothetical protein